MRKRIIGRPRDLEKEIRVLGLIADGLSVAKAARRVGIHRNSVYYIIKQREGSCADNRESLAVRQRLEELAEEKRELEATEAKTRRELEFVRLRSRIERLLVVLDKSLTAIGDIACRGGTISLDKELGNGATLYTFVCGDSSEAGDIAERQEVVAMLRRAMEQLSEIKRRAIELSFWSGEKQSRIAELLGVTEQEVNELVGSAVAELGAAMEEQESDFCRRKDFGGIGTRCVAKIKTPLASPT